MEKITKPGVYDLTIDEYHSDCCAVPSISAGGIKLLNDRGPAKYWWTSYLNPEHLARDAKALEDGTAKKKPHFRIGSVAHLLLFEPELVAKQVIRIPLDILGKNQAKSTKDAKEFVAAAERAGQLPVTPGEWSEIVAMRDALAAHPHASRALMKGRAEVSIVHFDEASGVAVKMRPDFLPSESGQYIVDYKTTADLSKWERMATCDLRYDIQAALSIWGAKAVLGLEPKGVLYLVQEKEPPYEVGMMAFAIEDLGTRTILDLARIEARKGLETFATCLDAGQWPSRYAAPKFIEPPGWRYREIEYRVAENTTGFANEFEL